MFRQQSESARAFAFLPLVLYACPALSIRKAPEFKTGIVAPFFNSRSPLSRCPYLPKPPTLFRPQKPSVCLPGRTAKKKNVP
jgi:hypothetical protein